jgi:hypothetical protein
MTCSDQTPNPPESGAPLPLTLGAFLVSLAAQLNRFNDAAVSPVNVRAVPLPPSNRKAYAARLLRPARPGRPGHR